MYLIRISNAKKRQALPSLYSLHSALILIKIQENQESIKDALDKKENVKQKSIKDALDMKENVFLQNNPFNLCYFDKFKNMYQKIINLPF